LAKDNRQFYTDELSGFFADINQLEDDFPQGLRFAHPADMSSLQKIVNHGGAMKAKNMRVTAVTYTRMICVRQMYRPVRIALSTVILTHVTTSQYQMSSW
jgi:hypothetical protein